MKAKDTVRLCPTTPSGWRINCDSRCHERQAEISFKAGMREVVEWVDNNPVFMQSSTLGIKTPIATNAEWEAKLKEWEV